MKSEITQIVSRNIALARKRRGWTQAHLAEQLNLVARSVGKYESGDMDCPYENLEKMAKFFDLEGGWLWFYQDHSAQATAQAGPEALSFPHEEELRKQFETWLKSVRSGSSGVHRNGTFPDPAYLKTAFLQAVGQ